MLPETMNTWLARSGAPVVAAHRPWPRFTFDPSGWDDLIGRLAVSSWSVLGLWAEALDDTVHLALRDESSGDVAVASMHCSERCFPTVSLIRPATVRLERAIQDLYGFTIVGLEDPRPWLDHGRWPVTWPLTSSPLPAAGGASASPPPYEFLPVDAPDAHRIPVGPVHAGIIEPGHFRFHANGEAVVRLEERLGYMHRGVERLCEGRRPDEAARIVARVSGDSTVAWSYGFARAVEAALVIEPPPRAVWLRAVLAEMERIANHLGDIGAICNDAAFPLLLAHCHALRERVARTAEAAFGHRLMMDCIVPGGLAHDVRPGGLKDIGKMVVEVRSGLAKVVALYETQNSLLDRTVGTGVIGTNLVHRFGAGGYVGRAALRDFDARLSPGYPPYTDLDVEVPVLATGDVNARLTIRVREAEVSLRLLATILDRLPDGPVRVDLPAGGPGEAGGGEGMALVESFRGELMVWVRLAADGTIARCHPRDPSWFQWPLLEAAIEGNIVADFPLCNKSFNGSYAGHDL